METCWVESRGQWTTRKLGYTLALHVWPRPAHLRCFIHSIRHGQRHQLNHYAWFDAVLIVVGNALEDQVFFFFFLSASM